MVDAKPEASIYSERMREELPELRSRFEDNPAVIYVVDRDMNIAWCNAAWDQFALKNGGESLRRESQIGRNVVEITPAPLRRFYANLYAGVFFGGREMDCEYECSSDETSRRFHMHLTKAAASNQSPLLVIVNSLIQEIAQDPPCTDYQFRDLHEENGLITMCSHCRRTRIPNSEDSWVWVPELVRTMPRHVSHGLCSVCFGIHYGADLPARR